jgi:hypothetical protein
MKRRGSRKSTTPYESILSGYVKRIMPIFLRSKREAELGKKTRWRSWRVDGCNNHLNVNPSMASLDVLLAFSCACIFTRLPFARGLTSPFTGSLAFPFTGGLTLFPLARSLTLFPKA